MNLGAVFFVGNLICSFHMLHTWPTQFYLGPPTSTFLATLVPGGQLKLVGDLVDLPHDLERINVAGTQLLTGQAETQITGG